MLSSSASATPPFERSFAELSDACIAATGIRPTTVSGSDVTTFRIGGPLSRLLEPRTEMELQAVLKFLGREGQSWMALGAGSNILVSDEGIDSWILRAGGELDGIEHVKGSTFRVGAGAKLPKISKILSDQGLSGLEFAAGIPGTIGGAVFMNAGAHGGEMSSLVSRVRLALGQGEIVELSSSDLSFSYRHSGLPNGSFVVSAELTLTESDKERTVALRAKNLEDRRARQPLSLPSAGSVFKNPSSTQPAGLLIDQCNLRGASHGGAMVSEKHGNWIVNITRTASAADVLTLIERCRREVEERFSVRLETEVRVW